MMIFTMFIVQSMWTNKQRLLVMSSRGLKARERHLMSDIRNMLPHAKTEAKYDMKNDLKAINEVR